MISPEETYTAEAYFPSRLPEDHSRGKLWPILCEYLQRDIPADGAVLELGGGYCHFINNIRASEKHVVDVYEGVQRMAAPAVKAYVRSCANLDVFADEFFATVFASNLFEHLAREELRSTLAEVRRVLRPGGRLIVIQPNFKYAYREYFDDYTHLQIFTETSLHDLLAASGFVPERVVARFLPFSLKGGVPKWAWLLRLYLALPWRPLAGQMCLVVRKPDSKQ